MLRNFHLIFINKVLKNSEYTEKIHKIWNMKNDSSEMT